MAEMEPDAGRSRSWVVREKSKDWAPDSAVQQNRGTFAHGEPPQKCSYVHYTQSKGSPATFATLVFFACKPPGSPVTSPRFKFFLAIKPWSAFEMSPWTGASAPLGRPIDSAFRKGHNTCTQSTSYRSDRGLVSSQAATAQPRLAQRTVTTPWET